MRAGLGPCQGLASGAVAALGIQICNVVSEGVAAVGSGGLLARLGIDGLSVVPGGGGFAGSSMLGALVVLSGQPAM